MSIQKQRIELLFDILKTLQDDEERFRCLQKIEVESLMLRKNIFEKIFLDVGSFAGVNKELKIDENLFSYLEYSYMKDMKEEFLNELQDIRNIKINLPNRVTNKVLIIFSSRVDFPGLMPSYLFEKFNFGSENILIFVRDPYDAFYTRGISRHVNSITILVNHIKQIISNLINKNLLASEFYISTIGASSGGLAAIYFGAALSAKSILTFSPVINLPRPDVWVDNYLIKNNFSVRDELISINSKTYIHLSSGCKSDLNQINNIFNDNVTVIKYDFGNQHNVPKILNEKGLLQGIFDDFIFQFNLLSES